MTVQILIGDALEQLRTLPDNSVDCCVTSPPYWGLRDYGVAGQLGIEPTLAEHIEAMVAVFMEVRRVLTPTGTCWINYGDCYATKPNGRSAADTKALGNDDRTFRDKPFSTVQGDLKPKDLAMVPNKLAAALQARQYTGQIKSELDRVWLACFLDGEGSIFIHRQPVGHPTGRGRAYKRTIDGFCVGLAFTNTSKALIEKCASIFGAENIQHTAASGNRKDYYTWRITGNKAKDILREIYPYLVAKQQEARVAINCPPSGDLATASWEALKELHKKGCSDFDGVPPKDDFWQPGWWVRSEIVWGKPNPMPDSSGRYRPSTAHEKIWLLTKSAKSFYDSEAVRMPAAESSIQRWSQDVESQLGSDRANAGRKTNGNLKAVGGPDKQRGHSRRHQGFNDRWDGMTKAEQQENGRLLRNYEPDLSTIIPPEVWSIATAAFSEAHFATFPPALVAPCIMAGCPLGGTVLDPFFGAGTTGLVADRLQRDCIGIELNPEYAAMAQDRIDRDRGGLLDVMEMVA